MTVTSLSRYLVSPQKLAKKMDWNKVEGSVVLALDIAEGRLGLAVSVHPSNNTVHNLDPISYMPSHSALRRSEQNKVVAASLREFLDKHKVDGIVVNWPLNTDGRLGKPCGKVLHLLDHFANEKILTRKCPFTLWHPTHYQLGVEPTMCKAMVDECGRSEIFSRLPSDKLSNVYHSKDHDQQ
eukprot:866955_1